MAGQSELTINFSANGNSLSYLGGGWARAEEGFTWATGPESHLLLPLGQDAREFVLTMNVIPFVHPPELSAQRLIVSLDETTIGVAALSRPTVLAWRIPVGLIRRAERTLVTFWHPDVARPRDLGAAEDDPRTRVFGVGGQGSTSSAFRPPWPADHPMPSGLSLWAARSVPVSPSTSGDVDLKEWVTRRTGLTLPVLASHFESLGDNCEFGLVQRRCDIEPLGLLRFSGSYSNEIVRGIELGFEGIGEPEDVMAVLEGDEGQREYMIHERKYGLTYHSFVYEGERSADLMRQQEATRLKFLRRKFVDEMDAGEKIFVVKHGARAPESEILPIVSGPQSCGGQTHCSGWCRNSRTAPAARSRY